MRSRGSPNPVWEQTESVEKFAAREPDLRLSELLDGFQDPAAVRVLDLGCAGGRNTVVLAERGFDVHARDLSRAMIARTRERLARIHGPEEAERRVRRAAMDHLEDLTDRSFDLVISLGVFHCASSREEWDGALSEATRVLVDGGRLLVSVFDPETDLHGTGITPVPDQPHVYDGFSSGRSFLVDAGTLDKEVARFGLTPAAQTTTVRVPLEKGRRVVVNAFYRKRVQR